MRPQQFQNRRVKGGTSFLTADSKVEGAGPIVLRAAEAVVRFATIIRFRRGYSATSRPSLQDVIKRCEQMRNGFFRFVAHVGEAEGLSSKFAVARVDHEMMFFAQRSRNLQDIDVASVFHARQRL